MTAYTTAGIFAGIGGIERGLEDAGHRTDFLCEVHAPAAAVLKTWFPNVRRESDVRQLASLPTVDIVAAGFPCQDLSQAGRTFGIDGANSGLVDELFSLIKKKRRRPLWVVLENVPFMLNLQRGRAMKHVTAKLESLSYKWAYRVVDSRSFGLPQRRRRVLIVASSELDPRSVLFADDAGERHFNESAPANGFYWTEGNRGLGWTADGVPTLKGGSGLGIPCPPAIWLREESRIVTPDVRDAERLQGFPADWTRCPWNGGTLPAGLRWKLVGNAVSVPMAAWLGGRLASPGVATEESLPIDTEVTGWPLAAWGYDGKAFKSTVSEFPVHIAYRPLQEFLEYPCADLSIRATSGFLSRARKSCLRFPDGFLAALEHHLLRRNTSSASAASSATRSKC